MLCNNRVMVPSTPINRGQKFVPRNTSSRDGVSKRPFRPRQEDGRVSKPAPAIGSFEGIIAREQSSRDTQHRYGQTTDSVKRPVSSRPPRVYHAVPTRPSQVTGEISSRRGMAPMHPKVSNQRSLVHSAMPQQRPAFNRPMAAVTGVKSTPVSHQKSHPRTTTGGASTSKRGGNRRAGGRGFQNTEPQFMKKREGGNVTPIGPDRLRIIPLGGQEEVGRNMTVFEYGDDIVIIDMGVQFPEEDMPGIDYIVPNVDYLKGKEHKIRGVLFTHGHLDHIGAAPILLKQLKYPTVISRDFTLALIKRKIEDQYKGDTKYLKTIRVNALSDRIRLGAFEARFFEVEHSIMDSMGIALVTPSGSVIHMGDWMISNEPIDTRKEDISYKHLQGLPRPTLIMVESLGALKKGMPPSETEVHANLQNLIRTAPGRIIIGTFASQVHRVAYLIEYAEQSGKKVALEGYSMKMNMEVAKELGYLKVKPETLITVNDIHKYADNQIVVICTGAQGESNAALSRIVTDNHRFIKLQKNDTILFSSSVIPGNERTVQRLKDNLYRKCDHVIHSDMMEIHISGHGTIWEIEQILRAAKADYVMPVYANHYFLKEAAKIAERVGYPSQNIFVLDNGSILEIPKDRTIHPTILKEKADSNYVFVDGLGIGDIGHVVLRDRQTLAADGMVVIIVAVENKTRKVLGNIQITSRGFIHVKENFDLVNEIKRKVQDIIKKNTAIGMQLDWESVKKQMNDHIGQFLFTKTERRPMVLPVIIEV